MEPVPDIQATVAAAEELGIKGSTTPTLGCSRRLRVAGRNGLHLRAATMVVKLVSASEAEVVLVHRGVQVNARSILSLASLGAAQGDTIEACATGPGAAAVMEAIARLFASGFEALKEEAPELEIAGRGRANGPD